MQLQYLKLDGYKNLEGLEINFQANENASVIIGNNGSGKSNIIEAISGIFAGLYLHNPKKIFNSKNKFSFARLPFGYTIHFIVKTNTVKINYNVAQGWKFTVGFNGEAEKEISQSDFFKREDDLLPSQVIANYSGEENRLFELFYEPFYIAYKKRFLKTGELSNITQKLFFVNKYFWQLGLLALIYKKEEGNQEVIEFFENTLGVTKINEIKFKFNESRHKKYPRTDTIKFVEKLMELEKTGNPITFDDILQSWNWSTDKYFFNLLSTAYLPLEYKIITEIIITYNDTLDSTGFSEGEKKLILLQFILEVLADEETLILFDEPDSHIHISRKEMIKTLLQKYPTRDNVLTTHSPTLTHCFDLKHIISISKNNGNVVIENNSKYELIDKLTNGIWSYQMQSLFLNSKNDILLVEGKHDKAHIQEALRQLVAEYPTLKFDIFDMNGATNIRQLLIGLYNSGYIQNKKVIGVYDDDKEGRESTKQNFDKQALPILKLKTNNNDPASETFLGVLYPKPAGYNGDFTVENFYDHSKYEIAYLEAVEKTKGFFGNKPIEDISEDIKLKSKNILADQCETFTKPDFEGFKPFFDLLLQIKNL